MKLFLNWNGKNAIVAAAIGYASMTMSSVFTSSSSSLGGQQQQGVGFVLYVAAQKICECYYCTDFGCFGSGYDCKCPNPLAEEGCCPTPKPTDAPSSIPSSTPTNAPSVTPVFECKADDDKITLEKNDKKITCEKINRKNWCDEKVKDEGGATANEFCTSCGCGESPVPSTAPTPSPPDEDCKGDDSKIKLTNQKKKMKCSKIKSNGLCEEGVENEDDKTAENFCTSCGCGEDPVPAPTPSPPDDACKDNDVKIMLTLENGMDKEFTCGKIETKELCGKKVKDQDGKTAENFCTSCGCGEDPVPAPTPSPPDEDCTLEDDDLLKLTTKNNEKTCAYINTKGLCDDPVENQDDKTAADFCISCGVCDGDPVPAPTPSPPDEDCKGDKDKIKLTNQEKLMKCEKIESNGFCEEKVENEDGKTAEKFCTSCGCGQERKN